MVKKKKRVVTSRNSSARGVNNRNNMNKRKPVKNRTATFRANDNRRNNSTYKNGVTNNGPVIVHNDSVSTVKKRTIKNKPFIVACCAILLLIGFFLVFNKKIEKTENGLIYNKNQSFIKSQKIKGVAFKDIKCTYNGKDSLISYIIINETGKKIFLSNYDIVIKDKNKHLITKIVASYSEDLKPGKKVDMANSVIGVDLSDAYYMELKLKTGKK